MFVCIRHTACRFYQNHTGFTLNRIHLGQNSTAQIFLFCIKKHNPMIFNISYKWVLWDKPMNPVMCSFKSNVFTGLRARKGCADKWWLSLSCCAPPCVCVQAPTRRDQEVSQVRTVPGLWLTCMDLATRIQLWGTTSVLLVLSLALGLDPALLWVFKLRFSVYCHFCIYSLSS